MLYIIYTYIHRNVYNIKMSQKNHRTKQVKKKLQCIFSPLEVHKDPHWFKEVVEHPRGGGGVEEALGDAFAWVSNSKHSLAQTPSLVEQAL